MLRVSWQQVKRNRDDRDPFSSSSLVSSLMGHFYRAGSYKPITIDLKYK